MCTNIHVYMYYILGGASNLRIEYHDRFGLLRAVSPYLILLPFSGLYLVGNLCLQSCTAFNLFTAASCMARKSAELPPLSGWVLRAMALYFFLISLSSIVGCISRLWKSVRSFFRICSFRLLDCPVASADAP